MKLFYICDDENIESPLHLMVSAQNKMEALSYWSQYYEGSIVDEITIHECQTLDVAGPLGWDNLDLGGMVKSVGKATVCTACEKPYIMDGTVSDDHCPNCLN